MRWGFSMVAAGLALAWDPFGWRAQASTVWWLTGTLYLAGAIVAAVGFVRSPLRLDSTMVRTGFLLMAGSSAISLVSIFLSARPLDSWSLVLVVMALSLLVLPLVAWKAQQNPALRLGAATCLGLVGALPLFLQLLNLFWSSPRSIGYYLLLPFTWLVPIGFLLAAWSVAFPARVRAVLVTDGPPVSAAKETPRAGKVRPTLIAAARILGVLWLGTSLFGLWLAISNVDTPCGFLGCIQLAAGLFLLAVTLPLAIGQFVIAGALQKNLTWAATTQAVLAGFVALFLVGRALEVLRSEWNFRSDVPWFAGILAVGLANAGVALLAIWQRLGMQTPAPAPAEPQQARG